MSKEDAHAKIIHELKEPGAERIWYIADAFRHGLDLNAIFKLTKVDPWFLVQIEDLIKEEQAIVEGGAAGLNEFNLRRLKRKGFSDKRMADLLGIAQAEVRKKRHSLDIYPVYKRVDTCAAEFQLRHRLHVLYLRRRV